MFPAAAPLQRTDEGVVAAGAGWFVVNAREARWRGAEGRGAVLPFEGETDFPQVGVNLYVLGPGEAMSMYHWEADDEDFLVVAGEGVLVVEGEERPLRRWDFVHCPAGTKHTILGAGKDLCVVLAVGAREHEDDPDWGGYTVDEVAGRHGVCVSRDTSDVAEAYSHVSRREPTAYRDGWLP